MSSGRTRWLRAAAVIAALAVASAACSSSSTPAASGSTPPTKPSEGTTTGGKTTGGTTASGVPAACGILTGAQIEGVLGTPPGTTTESGTAGARSVCMFNGGLIIGVNTLAAVDDILDGAKARNITYTSVSGHGDKAWTSEQYGVSTALVVKGSFGVDVGFAGTDQATKDKLFKLAEMVLAKIA